MANEQSIVAVGGLALVGANFWRGHQRQDLDGLVWKGQSTPGAKSALMEIAGELILLLFLYLLAGQSDTAGVLSITVIVGLGILYFMNQPKKG